MLLSKPVCKNVAVFTTWVLVEQSIRQSNTSTQVFWGKYLNNDLHFILIQTVELYYVNHII